MAKIKFDMEEIRNVMTKHAKDKYGLADHDDTYFDCDGASDVVDNVEFVIELKEQK
jgi:hypothetical protein